MAERGGFELSALPKEVREQLAELELELSEGECGVCVSACPDTGGEERGRMRCYCLSHPDLSQGTPMDQESPQQ